MTTRSRAQSRFGRLVSNLRQRRYITQRQLSQRTGLGYGTILAIECQPHSNPRASTLRRLASVLDVPVTDLFEALDDAPAQDQGGHQEAGGKHADALAGLSEAVAAQPSASCPCRPVEAKLSAETGALMTPHATTNDRMGEAVRA